MQLTDTKIRNAGPREKAYKLADGGGLTLIVTPNGSKWWRLRYRVAGLEKMLSLGVYPDIGLKRARERRDEARKQIAEGIDPSAQRRAAKAAQADTFEAVAREWLDLQRKKLAEVTYTKILWMLEAFIFPDLGSRALLRR
jgi:hypothetical protein